MGNSIKNTLFQLLTAGMFFCLPLFGGCQKKDIGNDTDTIPLSEIPENPAYTNLPLIGTKCKQDIHSQRAYSIASGLMFLDKHFVLQAKTDMK
ncbi:hypothetical protein JHJ32_09175 [Parapedobacter sp. ISTM3]|uniref:hypothetical protein n=1 Tax=Parapedobacter sp. ISTM3 TaxID=2800130 RepID=UPI00190756C6|nr:hypothetical protein [Parapedobacter sp. ISTM3]MBK1440155.1 hypothetical protein [Parapedobacter sp. ISTM3]